jgi:hypothetical protein
MDPVEQRSTQALCSRSSNDGRLPRTGELRARGEIPHADCWNGEKMDAQTEPDPTDAADKEFFRWLDDLQARGIWVSGDQLAPPSHARSIRVRDGKTIVTDGPFAETKEAIGGFDIIECGSLKEAVEVGRGTPRRQDGTIEVRRIHST